MKDSIDFSKENIPTLFKKMLYPTLLGMLFTALFTITDGIFVGRGLGSNAIAAVNIVAPLFLISTGLGLMFGMGGAVLASIHLAQEKIKTAKITITQATITATLIMLLMQILVFVYTKDILYILGCSDILMPLAVDYTLGFLPFMSSYTLIATLGFFIRLSGAPKYAMICTGIAALINIILDYLLIFTFPFGMLGAAFATGVGTAIGVILMLIYLFRSNSKLHFVKIKKSYNSLLLTIRNIIYICKLGFSSLLCELAIATMLICGNYVFMQQLGENGVAAFGIACYFFPIVFMLYNSISQSAQPIISYNYAESNTKRVTEIFNLALKTSLCYGLILLIITIFGNYQIISMFIPYTDPAFYIGTKGLPLFALGFLPFAANMTYIGYYQSIEQSKRAFIITLSRGFILMILSFIIMPILFGSNGAWLAVPVAETLTLIIVLLIRQ